MALFDFLKNKPVVQPSQQESTIIPVTEEYFPMPVKSNYDVTILPDFYSPGEVKNILSAPAIYTKYQVYSSMEIYWPRILKNITYLKNSVSSAKLKLQAFEENNAEAQRKLEIVDAGIKNIRGSAENNINTLKQIVEDIVASYGFGTSLQEILYEEKDGLILPYGSRFITPLNYEYSSALNKIYLKLGSQLSDFPENKFILSVYRNRSTSNLSTFGVYQSLAILYTFQTYAKKYLMQLSERFGKPIPVATYPKNADAKFKYDFNVMMANMGNSGYLLGPEGTTFELIASSINASNNPQQALLDYCDTQADITMLGQNLTSELSNQGSLAASKTHKQKEDNIINNILNYVIDTLNSTLVRYILLVNGENTDYAPMFVEQIETNFDLINNKLDVYNKLKNLGYTPDDTTFIKELLEYGINVNKVPEPVIEPTISNENKPISPEADKNPV